MTTSIHPTAIVESDDLGASVTVGEHATVGAGVTLADDVTIGPGARLLGVAGGEIVVRREVSIGANATVGRGVSIGRGAVVEAGSVVDADVPAHAVVRGNPARIVGYVDTLPMPPEAEFLDVAAIEEPTPTAVPGVVLHPMTRARDLRGSLTAIEFSSLPFAPRRAFAVHGVPSESVRGAHAHRRCGQLLFCMAGELSCVADDGTSRQELRLSSPDVGLLVPPMVWSMQYRYTRDAVLVVLAELPYDPDDYVRDYEEFLELVAQG